MRMIPGTNVTPILPVGVVFGVAWAPFFSLVAGRKEKFIESRIIFVSTESWRSQSYIYCELVSS